MIASSEFLDRRELVVIKELVTRDQGTRDRPYPGPADLDRLCDAVRAVDWKLHVVVVVPVRDLPVGNLDTPTARPGDR